MFEPQENWFRTRPKASVAFSLRLLMVSVALISFGLAAFAVSFRMPTAVASLPIMAVCWLAGASLLGGGICAPFGRATEGAIVGFVLGLGWTVMMTIVYRRIDC